MQQSKAKNDMTNQKSNIREANSTRTDLDPSDLLLYKHTPTNLEMSGPVDREYQNHIFRGVEGLVEFGFITSLGCPNPLLYRHFQIFTVTTFHNKIPVFQHGNEKIHY